MGTRVSGFLKVQAGGRGDPPGSVPGSRRRASDLAPRASTTAGDGPDESTRVSGARVWRSWCSVL